MPENVKALGCVLHMIDMFTNYYMGVYLEDKTARSVGNAIIEY